MYFSQNVDSSCPNNIDQSLSISPPPSIARCTKAKTKTRWITYMTDVEGDRSYMDRFVQQSKILCWRSTKLDTEKQISAETPTTTTSVPFDFPYEYCIDFVQSQTENDNRLVFGGDIWDQGGSDLYCVRQLLHLQHRYPTRVHFIAGNRDIDKMRLVQEMNWYGTHNTNDTPHPHPGVYWLRGTNLLGDPLLGALSHKTHAERLQWLLSGTMGSPRAFQYRKRELLQQHEAKPWHHHAIVSDEDVVESYRQSCHPVTGEMALYLQACQLFLRLGEVAFVHGALPLTAHNLPDMENKDKPMFLWDDLTFAMPWLDPNVTARELGVETIDDWIDSLNKFAHDNILAWKKCDGCDESEIWSSTGGYHFRSDTIHSFGQLLQYGKGSTPNRRSNATVVYNNWGASPRNSGKSRVFFRNDHTNPPDRSYVRHVHNFFERTNIRLICCGHQPVGEMPNHICIQQHTQSQSWVLMCDTSYSGDTIPLQMPHDQFQRVNLGRGNALSGRGEVAVSEVLIQQSCDDGSVLDAFCHGTLSDGTIYRTHSLNFDQHTSVQDTHSGLVVGTPASGPMVPTKDHSWWTQASLSDGSFLLGAGEGFKFWTNRVRP